MANIRYESNFKSSAGHEFVVQIYDKNLSSSVPKQEFNIGGNGPIIDYDSTGKDKFSTIMASKCTLEFVVETSNQNAWIQSIRGSTYEERDLYIVIYQIVNTLHLPLWGGYILNDLNSIEDVAAPFSVKLTAVDGLANLKEFPFVPNATTAGTGPFSLNQTYKVPGNNTNVSNSTWGTGNNHRVSSIIAEILGYAGICSNSLTNLAPQTGVFPDTKISISANWYNGDMDSTEVTQKDTLFLTAINTDQFYQQNQQQGSDVVYYTPMSCYEALENMMRCFGCRIFYWANRIYVIQPGLYGTNETGTTSAPVNIKAHLYNLDGTFDQQNNHVGDNLMSRYEVETFDPSTLGGIQRLTGTTWDELPIYKKVVTQFPSISNENLFTTFPLIYGTTNTPHVWINSPNVYQEMTEDIGTITDAASLDGLYFDLYGNYTKESSNNWVYSQVHFTIQAKPASVSSWNTSATLVPVSLRNQTTQQDTIEWHSYRDPSAISTYYNWGRYYDNSSIPSGHDHKDLFGPVTIWFPNPGTFNKNMLDNTHHADRFNRVMTTDSSMTGDWDFRFYTIIVNHTQFNNSSAFYYRQTSGHGVIKTSPWTANTRCPWDDSGTPGTGLASPSDLFYSVDTTQSVLAKVQGGQIGVIGFQTGVTTGSTETFVHTIPPTLWGDTQAGGVPGSLYIDKGATFGYSDFTGLWGKGVTTGNLSLTELLCQEVLFHSSQKTLNGNYTFATSTVNNNIASTVYPRVISPLSRITVPGVVGSTRNFILKSGSWNVFMNEVSGKWWEYSYNTTTTTTASVVLNPSNLPNNNYQFMQRPPTTGGNNFATERNQIVPVGTINPSSNSQISTGRTGHIISNPINNVQHLGHYLMSTTSSLTSGSTYTSVNVEFLQLNSGQLKTGDVLRIYTDNQSHLITLTQDVEVGDTSIQFATLSLDGVNDDSYPAGSQIISDLQDQYEQRNRKTRGKVGGLTVNETSLGSASEAIYILNGTGSELVQNNLFTDNETASQSRLEGGVQFANWVENPGSGKRTLTTITNGMKSTVPTGGDNQQTQTWHQRIYQNISSVLVVGQIYEFSAEFRTIGDSGQFRFAIQNLGSTDSQVNQSNFTTTDGVFQSFSEQFTCTSNTNQNIHIFPVYIQSLGSSFEVRNISLKQVNTAVGIGTSSPTTKLDIAGTAKLDKLKIATTLEKNNVLVINDETEVNGDQVWLQGSTATGASIRYSRGGSYQWRVGIGGGGTTNSNIPSSFFGIEDPYNVVALCVAHTTLNVGIGTTSPFQKLHVVGRTINERSVSSVGDHIITEFISTDGTNNPKLRIKSSSTGMKLQSAFSTGIVGSFEIQSDGGSSFIAFNTNGANERMRINSSGNVLIGTTSDDGSKVKVAGQIRVTDNYFDANSDGYGYRFGAGDCEIAHTGYNMTFKNWNGSELVENMRLTSEGKLGINLTSPTEKLHVLDGFILASGSGTSHGFELQRDGVDTFQIRHLDGNFTIRNSDNSTKDLVINSSGNIGIGNTNPSTKLHVTGNALVEGQISNNYYAFPNQAGEPGQVLQYPSEGDVLDWATPSSGGDATTIKAFSATVESSQTISSGGTTGSASNYSSVNFDTALITAATPFSLSSGNVSISQNGMYQITASFASKPSGTNNRLLAGFKLYRKLSNAENFTGITGTLGYNYDRGTATSGGAATWGTIYEGSGHVSCIINITEAVEGVTELIKMGFWIDGRSTSASGLQTIPDGIIINLIKLS